MKPHRWLPLLLVLLQTGCQDELHSYPEWSILQGLEANYRDRSVIDGTIFRRNGHAAVALRGSQGTTIWVLLDAKYEPYVKQLPAGDFSLTTDQYRGIEQSGLATEAVREFLRQHIR